MGGMERNGRLVRFYVVRSGTRYSVVEKTDLEMQDEGLLSLLVDMPQKSREDAEKIMRLHQALDENPQSAR